MAADPVVPAPELQIDREETGTETIFRCSGKITSSTLSQLQTIRSILPEKKAVALDLSNVSYLDSAGLGALVGLWVSAKKNGCELRLIKLSQRVKDLLHLTNLDKLFATFRFPDPPSF